MKKPAVFHDLKQDRADLTPPLPGIMALLPCLFYLTLLGAAGLGTLSVMSTKKAKAAEDTAVAQEQDEKNRMMALQAELTAIAEEQNRAKEVQAWVGSTSPLMTMVTSVINSVKTGNTLTSLLLSRTAENPEHVDLTLLINNGGSAQVDDTRNALAREGYQAFREDTKAAERGSRQGDMTYSAVFVNTGTPGNNP